jgi:hypothetical protein
MGQTAIELSQAAIARCVATVVRSRRTTRAFKAEPLRRERVQDFARLYGFSILMLRVKTHGCAFFI